jgi:hypothetical protein
VQDYADVAKLIEANHLPREYGVEAQVLESHRKLWDELRQPKKTQ